MRMQPKTKLSMIAGGLALGLGGACASALAGPAAAPSGVVLIGTPAPAQVVLVSAESVPAAASTGERIVIGSTEPTPESPQAARNEARSMMAQARQECRKEASRADRESCLANARDDYHDLMNQDQGQAMQDGPMSSGSMAHGMTSSSTRASRTGR